MKVCLYMGGSDEVLVVDVGWSRRFVPPLAHPEFEANAVSKCKSAVAAKYANHTAINPHLPARHLGLPRILLKFQLNVKRGHLTPPKASFQSDRHAASPSRDFS